MDMLSGGLKRVMLAAAGLTLLLPAVPAAALDIDNLRAELEARRAERAAAREQRMQERADRLSELFGPAETSDSPGGGAEQADGSPCSCSARMSYSSPDLQFRNGVLTFIPRADVSVRTHGEAIEDNWTVDLDWTGTATFTSSDVPAPVPVAFSGRQHVVGGRCGNNRYSYRGLALPEVPFTGIAQTLFTTGSKLDGLVRMQTNLTGCDSDTEHKQFPFTVRTFGNLLVKNWHSAR
ncbi:MAG: hypothetical protein COT71_04205 [Candidatus Andersenbacteria bacterium CG10_big_fil_rev_8_21_14_0_10_54_11]|uniref:Uncharacterized protein n=1 Tax=Candidatus Andersenbacteria bacterium CG10_big_fil_rev_8_21_14_0_10_54_11 TaxID=1974485 RepID=A0A2M6WYD6_9BACT|nr:MAG: hypothetical protein COT71_04205 [Candidatus Andersenbacteria bacterium CG10_big_fil_rev_8_21_14_0_10_54_11]